MYFECLTDGHRSASNYLLANYRDVLWEYTFYKLVVVSGYDCVRPNLSYGFQLQVKLLSSVKDPCDCGVSVCRYSAILYFDIGVRIDCLGKHSSWELVSTG